MFPSRARYDDGPAPAAATHYLVGFRHFANVATPEVLDYEHTEDVDAYLADVQKTDGE